MAQEFFTQDKMQEVIDLLNEYGVDFKVKDNKIMIKGDVQYVDLHSLPTIIISQGDNKISFDEYMDWNRVVVTTPNHVGYVELSKYVYANYDYPYLIIHF